MSRNSEDEKGNASIEHVEKSDTGKFYGADSELLAPDRRPSAERRLVRKLDFRLLPAIILVYIMNYIDRNAIPAARLKGLEADLHLNDVQYSTVLAVLYASYVPAQIPSNIVKFLLQRFYTADTDNHSSDYQSSFQTFILHPCMRGFMGSY